MEAYREDQALHGRRDQVPRGLTFHTSSLAILIFLPWWMFTMISCLFCYAYHRQPILVWVFVAICVVVSCIFVAANVHKGLIKPMFWLFLGVLCILGCLASAIIGLYNYEGNMASYHYLEEGQVYLNVLPSSPARAHRDASVITFATDAGPSTTHGLGYNNGDEKYCVAPVLGPQPASSVEFWAAGVDCCSTGDFSCDDAKKAGAHGGAVIFDPSPMVAAPVTRSHFVKAAREAAAYYNLQSAEEPIFVRWVQDPAKTQHDAWWKAAHVLVLSIFVHLVISVLLALVVHLGSRPGKRPSGSSG